jgi:hypothetical protein
MWQNILFYPSRARTVDIGASDTSDTARSFYPQAVEAASTFAARLIATIVKGLG